MADYKRYVSKTRILQIIEEKRYKRFIILPISNDEYPLMKKYFFLAKSVFSPV